MYCGQGAGADASQRGTVVGYARGPFAVDWEDRYDMPALRRGRVERARAELLASDLDALLLWKNENVRYLTSLRAQLIAYKASSLNGVLMGRDSGPVLLASGGEMDRARAGMPWLADAHAIPIMEQRELVDGFVTTVLAPRLHDLGLRSGRIGIDQANISLIESIGRHLPAFDVADGDLVMLAARLVKLPEEIAIIEEACAIGDAVTQRAIDESATRPARMRGGRRRDADPLLPRRRDAARRNAIRRLGRAHVPATPDQH